MKRGGGGVRLRFSCKWGQIEFFPISGEYMVWKDSIYALTRETKVEIGVFCFFFHMIKKVRNGDVVMMFLFFFFKHWTKRGERRRQK